MMQAAATLTGNAIGARDLPRQKKLARTIVFLEVALMLVSGALLFAFAPPLVGLFSKDPAVFALGVKVLRMVACSEPVYGVCIALEGMLQGAGKTKIPFVINMTGMWGVRILGTWICTVLLHLGLEAAWGCMIGHNVLLFLLFGAYYLRGNWNPLKQA
jgi:Na+-driven multidrug efflux pump